MPGSAEDFEEAWAQIVADLSADLPTGFPDEPPQDSVGDVRAGTPTDPQHPSGHPGSRLPEGVDQQSSSPVGGRPPDSGPGPSETRQGDQSVDGTADSDTHPPTVPGPTEPPDAATVLQWGAPPTSQREQSPQPGGTDPGAFVDNWADEGHYLPPPPPELPAGTPAKRLAWAGMLGGPATLLLSALTPWNPPPIVALGAGLATVAGFVTLVWMLPENRDDGWDDGARV